MSKKKIYFLILPYCGFIIYHYNIIRNALNVHTLIVGTRPIRSSYIVLILFPEQTPLPLSAFSSTLQARGHSSVLTWYKAKQTKTLHNDVHKY